MVKVKLSYQQTVGKISNRVEALVSGHPREAEKVSATNLRSGEKKEKEKNAWSQVSLQLELAAYGNVYMS